MERLIRTFGPYAVIVCGISLCVSALATIKLFYPQQSENLPWQPVCMVIALATGALFGKLSNRKISLWKYLWLGLLFSNAVGAFGMIYLKTKGYITHVDEYVDVAPLAILYFVILVTQNFALGSLATDRGSGTHMTAAGNTASRGSNDSIAFKSYKVAYVTMWITFVGIVLSSIYSSITILLPYLFPPAH